MTTPSQLRSVAAWSVMATPANERLDASYWFVTRAKSRQRELNVATPDR
jgi:hypothetical protein